MAEDVRAVLPQLHQEHIEQHGVEAAAVAQHDFHLERSVLFVAVVGEVSVHHKYWTVSSWYMPPGQKSSVLLYRFRDKTVLKSRGNTRENKGKAGCFPSGIIHLLRGLNTNILRRLRDIQAS